LEALAATGLRSVRYVKEIGVHVDKILANDWDLEASKLIEKNFEFNGVEKNRTEVTSMDGIDLMYERRKNLDFYDVVDLDPYGTAVPFLDAAVQSISNGGLL
jgi:tRNA (guanine26-N2/guanine27-N2)-dimethyltransferase